MLEGRTVENKGKLILIANVNENFIDNHVIQLNHQIL